MSGLKTDLYELTMAAAYFESGRTETASFELFVRKLPAHRSFLVVAGLEQALDFLEALRFTSHDISYLCGLPVFKNVSREFFAFLEKLRFTGQVWAMPEGTVAFANEPLLRVTAPIIEAQIVETALLAIINHQTSIATKAARVVAAARGRPVIEFGTRRAHGIEAGILGARAAYIGGCAGTSNVEAGRQFGIPVFGTLAHSFIMAHEREADAFDNFLKVFPETATILVDTYDTIAAVKSLRGKSIPAVRLDSGDLVRLSKEVRKILDDAGMRETKIFTSGDLNEDRIAELLAAGAPIDAFGVGTQLSTSYDAPALGGVYKLVSGRIKLSAEKATYPGPKQVWRSQTGDVITAADETAPGEPLLAPAKREPLDVIRHRAMFGGPRPVVAARDERTRRSASLHEEMLNYPVRFSDRLEAERRRMEDEIRQRSSDPR